MSDNLGDPRWRRRLVGWPGQQNWEKKEHSESFFEMMVAASAVINDRLFICFGWLCPESESEITISRDACPRSACVALSLRATLFRV